MSRGKHNSGRAAPQAPTAPPGDPVGTDREAPADRSCAGQASPCGSVRIVGIVGGVGSGKTLVSRELKRLGAEVLDADRAGHEVLEHPEVRQAVRTRWGEAVLDADGRIDRGRLAEKVFGPPPAGPEELRYLECLTHPRIEALLERRIAQLVARGAAVVVLDAAVMLEAGWDRWCDRIVFVDAPLEVRQARCRQRGWSDQQYARREAAQGPLEWKRRRADWVIDNSGSLDSLRHQVQQIWYNIRVCPPRDPAR